MGEFFDSWWLALAVRGWEAVVLHSWQDLPARIRSDIDFAARGPEPGELLRFLATHAREHGWRLIQIVEHEPGAFFCVCIQTQAPFKSLQLDVCWSYRRLGHLLLRSEILFSAPRQPPSKTFRIPSAGAEFAYLIAKAAAKGKKFEEVRGRLAELWKEDANLCHTTARLAFGDVPRQEPAGRADPLAVWEEWFAQARCFSSVRRVRRLGMRELALYLRRIILPTGYFLPIQGNLDCDSRQQIEQILMPAFRGCLLAESTGWFARVRHWVPLIRTRLVIGTSAARQQSEPCRDVEATIHHAIEALSDRASHRIRSMQSVVPTSCP